MKRIKKLLSNRQAFYQYKKRGSLVRDQDYLSIPTRVKDKIMIDNIKEVVLNKKHKIIGDFNTEKKVKKKKRKITGNGLQKDSKQSINLQFEQHNIGLFSDFQGNLRYFNCYS